MIGGGGLGFGEGGGQRCHGRFDLGSGILRCLGSRGRSGGGFLGGDEFPFNGLKRLGGIFLGDERLRHGDAKSTINGLNRQKFDGGEIVVLFLCRRQLIGLDFGRGLGLCFGRLRGLQIGLCLFHSSLAGGDQFSGLNDLGFFLGHFSLCGSQRFVGFGLGVLSAADLGLQRGFDGTEIAFLGGS